MIIGRENELGILRRALEDEYSSFIAVYGRRRIGKTFLIREAFGYRFTFQHAGLSKGGLKEQMEAFESSLKEAGFPANYRTKNWSGEFEKLKDLIRQSTERKKVIFIDELSWMDTPRSDLITALENFWNGWASARKDIVLIVCASATSWIMSKVVHNKGGLYNRLTGQIHLDAFCLAECEEYIRAKNLALNRSQILQYYMVFGGIPYYWGFLEKGQSLSQNIDRILFAKNAPLKKEFQYLYASVFKHPAIYLQIVEALSRKKAGMTREELIAATGLANSGTLTVKLEELENCGFIRKYSAFGKKKKDAVYQLMDSFTLFWYHFMQSAPDDEHFWTNQINTPAINTWLGLAFERVCLMHVAQMKKKLGISGVLTNVHSWFCHADADKGLYGSQIDLLLARKDQVINLCEMKYSDTDYILTQREERAIRNKIHDLRTDTGTRYALHPTLVTTCGIVRNSWSEIFQAVITLDDLFSLD